MTHEWKHLRPYPVAAARTMHDRSDRIANLIVITAAVGIVAAWIGYGVGSAQRDAISAAQAAEVPRITTCPQSNADQDVIEHAWTHRGVLIHRECLIVSKPVYASPRYSLPPNGL